MTMNLISKHKSLRHNSQTGYKKILLESIFLQYLRLRLCYKIQVQECHFLPFHNALDRPKWSENKDPRMYDGLEVLNELQYLKSFYGWKFFNVVCGIF